MDIADLTVESEDVELEATIKDIKTPRAVSGKYGQKRITIAQLEDETGEIQVTLWEEQIDAVEEGARVRVEGAYTRDWAGDLQLNIPREGSIEIVDAGGDTFDEEPGFDEELEEDLDDTVEEPDSPVESPEENLAE